MPHPITYSKIRSGRLLLQALLGIIDVGPGLLQPPLVKRRLKLDKLRFNIENKARRLAQRSIKSQTGCIGQEETFLSPGHCNEGQPPFFLHAVNRPRFA